MKAHCFIHVIIAGAFLCSCSNVLQDKDSTTFSIEPFKDKFKYGHLDSFAMDTFEFGGRPKHYTALDTHAFRILGQDSLGKFEKDKIFFYSLQTQTGARMPLRTRYPGRNGSAQMGLVYTVTAAQHQIRFGSGRMNFVKCNILLLRFAVFAGKLLSKGYTP